MIRAGALEIQRAALAGGEQLADAGCALSGREINHRCRQPRLASGAADAGGRNIVGEYAGAFHLDAIIKNAHDDVAIQAIVAVEDSVDNRLFHHPLGVRYLAKRTCSLASTHPSGVAAGARLTSV
jgi:hypothetical protein